MEDNKDNKDNKTQNKDNTHTHRQQDNKDTNPNPPPGGNPPGGNPPGGNPPGGQGNANQLPEDPLRYSQPKFTATWQVYPGMYQPGLRVMADTGVGTAEWLRHLGSPNPLPFIQPAVAPGGDGDGVAMVVEKNKMVEKNGGHDEVQGGGRKKRRKSKKTMKRRKSRKNKTNKKKRKRKRKSKRKIK